MVEIRLNAALFAFRCWI